MASVGKIRFNIKVPKGARKTFALTKQVIGEKSVTIQDERIDAINTAFKAGTIDINTATSQMKDVRADYLKHENLKLPQRVKLGENLDLFEKFWDAHYANRDLIDPKSARNDFVRALEALGTKLSLLQILSRAMTTTM